MSICECHLNPAGMIARCRIGDEMNRAAEAKARWAGNPNDVIVKCTSMAALRPRPAALLRSNGIPLGIHAKGLKHAYARKLLKLVGPLIVPAQLPVYTPQMRRAVSDENLRNCCGM